MTLQIDVIKQTLEFFKNIIYNYTESELGLYPKCLSHEFEVYLMVL
jgi:hypothetical protein